MHSWTHQLCTLTFALHHHFWPPVAEWERPAWRTRLLGIRCSRLSAAVTLRLPSQDLEAASINRKVVLRRADMQLWTSRWRCMASGSLALAGRRCARPRRPSVMWGGVRESVETYAAVGVVRSWWSEGSRGRPEPAEFTQKGSDRIAAGPLDHNVVPIYLVSA